MKKNKKSNITMAKDYNLLKPEEENAFPVPESDWDFLRRKVESINEPTKLYSVIYSSLFGVAGSALVALIGLPSTIESSVTISCWIAFIGGLILGFVFLYFDYRVQNKISLVSKSNVLEEMDRLKSRFKSSKN